MFGIAVYPGMDTPIEEVLEYMKRAKEFGIKTLFTSAHIPERNENFFEDLKSILEASTNLGFTSIVDISKSYYEAMDLSSYKIDYLRLDYGFTLEEMVAISKSGCFGISVNATTLTKEEIEKFITLGGDITKINASHNYYPRRDTGVCEELFKERNDFIKSFGIKTLAFIPSQYKRRGPIYEGLPTLEKHRDLDTIVSGQHLVKLGIDYVVIGDEMASIEELEILANVNREIVTLPIKLCSNLRENELELLKMNHTNRIDPGEFVIRSQESRIEYKGNIKQNNILDRSIYSVTVDNELYTRYEGELQILKLNMHSDNRVNVVGNCKGAELLINNLKPGEKFNFHIIY